MEKSKFTRTLAADCEREYAAAEESIRNIRYRLANYARTLSDAARKDHLAQIESWRAFQREAARRYKAMMGVDLPCDASSTSSPTTTS